VSSLKDWYRYVDSRARSRPGGGPPGSESAADDPTASPAAPGTEAQGPEAPSAAVDAALGEEGLDVWSGLFPQKRKPDEKPTTGPLRRASAPDEAPADLSFAQAPIDSPPAPTYPLPEPQLEIPSFDQFVSPFAPEPPSAEGAAAGSIPATTGQGESAGSLESAALSAATPRAAAVSPEPPAESVTVSTGVFAPSAPPAPAEGIEASADCVPEGQPTVAQAFMPGEQASASASPVGTAESSQALQAPPSAPESAALTLAQEATPPTNEAEEAATAGASDETEDDGQVPWRSPFRLPGPGRTVSSGGAPPRAASTAPRVRPDRSAALEEALSTVAEHAIERSEPRLSVAQRPLPGSPEWERERVERLARTFRETLEVLEQVRVEPPVGSLVSVEETPAATAAAPPLTAPEAPLQAVAETESPLPHAPLATAISTVEAAMPTAAEARTVDAPLPAPAAAMEPAPPVEPRVAAALPAPSAAQKMQTPASLPPEIQYPTPDAQHLPSITASPDMRQSIEEAALIRERLPQHIDMLLRIPTNEVAQNSYKSPFRETREDLVRRLLDPQLTLEEAARVLGVCPTTVRRYTNRGMLHCHRTPGNQRRFRMSDVLQFLEQFGDRIDRAAEARQMEEAA
jgi:excisionase family DNA binding protein